jgi:citrate synthase
MANFLGRIEFPVTIELGRGLDGAITNVTKVGFVDGVAGKLIYRGYSIEDLCEHSNYEEVAYLLIHGKLPNRRELSDFSDLLRKEAVLPAHTMKLIESMPRDAHPMNLLQAAISAMGCTDPSARAVTEHVSDPAAGLPMETQVGIRVLSRLRTVAAAIARARRGLPLVPPDPSLGFTANYLYMMNGEKPDPVTEKVIDVTLILQADHGMNASTFTAMIVHSCLSDMYSTVAAAIGALRGPLHGGANEQALDDLREIGGPQKAGAWVAAKMAKGQKIIGFGHRVYKVYDPRARVMKKEAEKLCRNRGLGELYETAVAVDDAVCAAMKAAGKSIFPNVDFYSGLVYQAIGFPPPLFPVIFAVSRTAGWVARVLEYLPENRLFRPRAAYEGPMDSKYVPINDRT